MSPKRRSSARQNQAEAVERAPGERLQKVLAAAGVASRRHSEELILDGRVEVDGRPVTELGTRVDPAEQEIRVDGAVLPRPKYVYYLLNKPSGVVSTNDDPSGRPRVIDLVPAEQRLFTIGRLDRSSEGLIIVTNDGELTNRLTHPRYGIPKTYRAKVQGRPTEETLRKLREGVHLAEGLAQVDSLKIRGRHARGLELEIVLTEGRNREIRRILAKVGHKVQQLRRTAIGDVRLGRLKVGEYRPLSHKEIRLLRQAAGSSAAGSGGRKTKAVSRRAKRAKASQASARAGRSNEGRKAGKGTGPRTSKKSNKRAGRPSGRKKRTSGTGQTAGKKKSTPSSGKKKRPGKKPGKKGK